MDLGKSMFVNTPSTSYSQFLYSNKHTHFLTEPPETFLNIELFRRSVFLHYQNVYTKIRWQNWLYRIIFFSLSLIFLICSLVIYFKTANFLCNFYFKHADMVKNAIDCGCLFMAGSSFAIGYMIHPEKEAMHYLAGKVGKEFNHSAKQLQNELNAFFRNLSQEWVLPDQFFWINKTT